MKNFQKELDDYFNQEWSSVQNYKFKKNKNMNGIGSLSWVNIKSAVVYGLVLGVLAVLGYAINVGDLFALNFHMVVNSFFFGFAVSLVKNLLTTDSGKFMGLVKVVPEVK